MLPFRSGSRRSRRSLDEHRRSSSNPYEWQADREKYIMTFPIHPLPSMQAPFEESMLDATGETGFVPFLPPNKNIDSRQQLLCKEPDASDVDWNYTYSCHWRNNPKGKFHPVSKTVAQIVFGVHLLHQHLEKSVADVADILLKHVNELDGFLQRANEDIEGSLKDMLFRRKCLKVPMEHVSEFDRLLDDRTYRAQLLDGNIVIERTINRMSALLNDYLVDMSTFRDANHELDVYLGHIGDAWVDANDDIGRIYSAMCGNTAGWSQFLQSLAAKAEKLGVVLVQVSSYCNEIEKRCGAASRRSLIASRSSSRSTNSRDAARSFRNFADNKPLPMVPNERPPFITTPPSGSDMTPEDGPVERQHGTQRPPAAAHIRTVTTSSSDESLKQQNDTPGSSSAEASHSEETVSHRNNRDLQPELRQQPSASGHDHHRQHRRQEDDARADSHRNVPIEASRAEYHSPSDSDTNDTIVPQRATQRDVKGEHSPPLTGKDSAYSSVSGGSFASPVGVQPRSASAQSSYPRAQFGLFPTSSPGTPKHSVSGRHGAISPALSSPRPSEQPPPSPLPPRAQTSLDNYNNAPSSRRLLRKSSLSSIKRLFSKRKTGTVDTIAE